MRYMLLSLMLVCVYVADTHWTYKVYLYSCHSRVRQELNICRAQVQQQKRASLQR